MTCNLRSLFYFLKKVKNKKNYTEDSAKKIIQQMLAVPYLKSLNMIFKSHDSTHIFDSYNLLSCKLYEKNIKHKTHNVVAREKEWGIFYRSNMLNKEFHRFYGLTSEKPLNCQFNLFKFIFW